MTRPPLWTPEEARAEAEAEGKRDDRDYEIVKEGGWCCLTALVTSLGIVALPIAGLFAVVAR